MASRKTSRAASGFPLAGSTRGGLTGAEGGGGGGTKAGEEVGGVELSSLWTFMSSSSFLICSNSLAAPDLV